MILIKPDNPGVQLVSLSLQERLVLVTDEGETQLAPGICAGFKAGTDNAHQLINRGSEEVVYLDVGDRTPEDAVAYPDEDLLGSYTEGGWRFTRKDGSAV